MNLFTPYACGFKIPQNINYDFWRELIGSITLRATVYGKKSLKQQAEELHVLLWSYWDVEENHKGNGSVDN